jgi:hypothetical protein
MTYPFPTPDTDELFDRFGLEPANHSLDALDHAKHEWSRIQGRGLDAEFFLQLLAVCDSSVVEATVVWDGLRSHLLGAGLSHYLERSSRYYVQRYAMVNERAVRRAFNDLADAGLIVMWPRARQVGQKFRVDFVELAQRLATLEPRMIPGTDTVVGCASGGAQ